MRGMVRDKAMQEEHKPDSAQLHFFLKISITKASTIGHQLQKDLREIPDTPEQR